MLSRGQCRSARPAQRAGTRFKPYRSRVKTAAGKNTFQQMTTRVMLLVRIKISKCGEYAAARSAGVLFRPWLWPVILWLAFLAIRRMRTGVCVASFPNFAGEAP